MRTMNYKSALKVSAVSAVVGLAIRSTTPSEFRAIIRSELKSIGSALGRSLGHFSRAHSFGCLSAVWERNLGVFNMLAQFREES